MATDFRGALEDWAIADFRASFALAAWARDIQDLVPEIMRYSTIHYVSQLTFELGPLEGLEAWPEYAERFPGELLGADAGLIGASDAARGRFAAVAGDLDRAVELLEAGHAMHAHLELPQLRVESGLDLGIVLLRRDQAGDRDRATALLRTTAELAGAIGMVPAEAQARALIA